MSYDSIRLNIMPNLFSKTTSLDGKIKLHNGGKQLKSLVNVIDVARCMRFVGEDKKINKEILIVPTKNLLLNKLLKFVRSLTIN